MYKIVSNDLNVKDLYVGHTTDFRKRKNRHKSVCINQNSKSYDYKLYQFIRENGNWEYWTMVLVEKYPCNDSLEATQRERFWCEQLNATLNMRVPSRTDKEYKQDNKEYYAEYMKQYYHINKDKFLKQKKEYHEKNKATIHAQKNKKCVCECGCIYTYVNKQRHLRSQQHEHYEEFKIFYIIRQGLDVIKAIDAKLESQLDL
jgi:hypothetical protein